MKANTDAVVSAIDRIFNAEVKHSLVLFNPKDVEALESELFEKNGKSYLKCSASGKERMAKPEEIVRQLWIRKLIREYRYPVGSIQVEFPIHFGRQVKKADIVVVDKDRPTTPYIIVEVKKTRLKDGKEQLKSYCNASGAPIGVWSDGALESCYYRKDPNYFNELSELPRADQSLAEIFDERLTIDDLIKRYREQTPRKSLKDVILEMEDEVLANAGVDVFEEVFKLIFTKLYDEWASGNDRKRYLEFRNTDTESDLRRRIQGLFDHAKQKWEGVFAEDEQIKLSGSHLLVCVSYLENEKLFNTNLEVIDEAFEYLINQSSKGEKGQYFTPRYVIDMCVKMLNPKENETLIDTAAGSAGFTVHGIFKVWRDILRDLGLQASHLFTLEKKPPRCIDYVNDKVFAIDFDERSVRVARCLNLIAGDGQTNVLHLNSLDWKRWDERTADERWIDTYNEGWKKLKRLRAKPGDNRRFQFDVLMANPPFAGDIKQGDLISLYELGHKANGKIENAVGRDLLFIERNLDFLRPGGRMAIVLPQGRLNNSSDKRVRDYIAERCRILAVVGLHPNTFKPHTGTKTSVLVVQKWNDDPTAGPLCPRVDDYNIFFATQQKPGKDTSGDKIFERKQPDPDRVKEAPDFYKAGRTSSMDYLTDEHGHWIVEHDLFNYEGLTRDGIAEAFEQFATKERLSFF